MWLKVVLMSAFFVFVVLLSRLMDMALNGNDLLSAHIFLNTIGFSVKQLKYLLDARGISYDGVLERPELIQLVDESGPVTERQLMDCERDIQQTQTSMASDMQIMDTNGGDGSAADWYQVRSGGSGSHRFGSGAHLYEEVEDTKDSAWIVNVMADSDGHQRIDGKLWQRVADKCQRFGIRTAIFDCSLDPELCLRKGWLSSRLILALPREGLRTKEDVLMMTYSVGRHTRLQHIIDWIHRQLATRVSRIESVDDLENNWLKTSAASNSSVNAYNEIKMVFISSLATPPLILSALAIKFSGRIRFGFFRTDTKRKRSVIARLDKRIPSYIVVLADRHYHYGTKAGESLKYQSMELMLRTLRPETNDLFLVSLLLTNLSLGLHLFWMKCSRLWKHVVYWLMTAIKYNGILFLVWLTALAVFNLPVMAPVCAYGHRLCQWLALTSAATIIRYDLQYNYKFWFLLVSFAAFSLLLAFVRRRLVSSSVADNDDHLLFRDWTPWESTLLSYILFRPITMNSFHRSLTTASIDMNLEEGMELLIERLAVPNLWLQPELISSDYVKELPVWSHQMSGSNGSEVSDSDAAIDSDSSVACSDVLSANTTDEYRTTHSRHELNANSVTKSTLEASPKALNSSHKHTGAAHQHSDKCFRSSTPKANTSNNYNKCVDHKQRVSVSSRHQRQPQTNTTGAALETTVPKEKSAPSTQNLIPDGMIKCNDCAICLEVYRNGVSICGLPCGHNYHENCIMLWLYRDNHCCPTCRWPTYKQKVKLN